jgi:hypothetical protein
MMIIRAGFAERKRSDELHQFREFLCFLGRRPKIGSIEVVIILFEAGARKIDEPRARKGRRTFFQNEGAGIESKVLPLG